MGALAARASGGPRHGTIPVARSRSTSSSRGASGRGPEVAIEAPAATIASRASAASTFRASRSRARSSLRRSASPRGSGLAFASPMSSTRAGAPAASPRARASTSISSWDRPAGSASTVEPTCPSPPPSVSGEACCETHSRAISSNDGPRTPARNRSPASRQASTVRRASNRRRSGRTITWLKRTSGSTIRSDGRRARSGSADRSTKPARSSPSSTCVIDVSRRPSAAATAPADRRPTAMAASADW